MQHPHEHNTLNIAVLMGGNSAEAEVSRNSAQQIAEALLAYEHRVTRIELDSECARALLALAPDVVFPALHGPPGEDGTVQGLLEILELPYVGSGVRGSAMAMDKSVAKSIFNRRGLPVLDEVLVSPATSDDLQPVLAEIEQRFGQQVVIKPLNQGSAIGVTPLPEGGNVEQALRGALAYGSCLVEPYFVGKEITVGILERGTELIAHPVIEIRTAEAEWYDYENRYKAGQSEHIIPAPLPAATLTRLQEIAIIAHTELGLRDLSRADFIVAPDNEIALLEVNTLPGMTPTSLYPDGAQQLGYSFAGLMHLLVMQASMRGCDTTRA